MHLCLKPMLIISVLLVGCERRTVHPATEVPSGSASPPVQASNTPESTPKRVKLRTVDEVDLDRFMGKWYEYARYQNAFQKDIVGVIAEYRIRGDGRIDVINTGRVGALDGPLNRSESVGWFVEGSKNTRWRVEFFWPLTAPYWIIDLDEDYQYAVVGQPSRKYLWILSRSPQLDDNTYEGICHRLKDQGYDPTKLIKTPQPASSMADALPE